MHTYVRSLATLSLIAAGAVGAAVGCGSDGAVDDARIAGNDAGADGSEGGANPSAVAVTPSEVRLGVLRPQTFTSTSDVTWNVEEGERGGRIDESGKYASPETPGVYHVVATSKVDPSVRAKATVTVAPLGASILVGKAGGPGTLDGPTSRARFMGAAGIGYLRYSDTLVVADATTHTIRKVAGKTVTTIAGSPMRSGTADGIGDAARFDGPADVVAEEKSDGDKRVWVLDAGNRCVRKIDVDTGEVTAFAGKCGTSGNQDSTDGTGATARFGNIESMILGPAKDALYVCEVNQEGFTGIRRIDAVTGKTTSITSVVNNHCRLAANDYTDDIYFNVNATNHNLFKFADAAGGPPTPVTPVEVCPSGPRSSYTSLAIDSGYSGGNALYGAFVWAIHRCDLATNEWTTPFSGNEAEWWHADGTLADARFNRAAMTASSPDATIFVADQATVRAIYPTKDKVETLAGLPRAFEPVDGPRATAKLTYPNAVAVDEAGNVVIADGATSTRGNNTLRKFDVATASLARLAGKATTGYTVEVPVDGSKDVATFVAPIDMVRAGGELFVIDAYGQTIRKVHLATGDVTTLAGEPGKPGTSDGKGAYAHFKFYDSSTNVVGGGLATDGANLYVADPGNFAIRKVVIATGEVTTLAGGTFGTEDGVGAEAQFIKPTDLAFVDGVLYVVDSGDHTIRRVEIATGKVTSFVGASAQEGTDDGVGIDARLAGPVRIAADAIGNLYVTQSSTAGRNVLRRIDIATRRVSTFAGAPYQQGFASGPLPTTLGCPANLEVGPNGDLLIADGCSGIVSVIGVVDP